MPWTDPTIVKALTLWKGLFDDGIMQEGALGTQQYPDANNGFMSGKYAMVMMGGWYMQYSTVEGMTAAISGAGVADPSRSPSSPSPSPTSPAPATSGSLCGDADFGLAVNQKSKNIAAATTFATWLGTSTEGQQAVADILNDIPALVSAQPNWDTVKLVNPEARKPALEKLISDAGKSSEPRLATVVADLQTAIGVASTTVAAGEATPEEAAAAPAGHRFEDQVTPRTEPLTSTTTSKTGARRPSGSSAPGRRSRAERSAPRPSLDPARVRLRGRHPLLLHRRDRLPVDPRLGRHQPDSPSVGLQNYQDILVDPIFWQAIWHTVIFFVVTFTAQTAIGFVFAALLPSKVKLATVYKVIVFTPVVIAPATMAPVFRQMFAADGQLNWFLDHVGLGFLSSPGWPSRAPRCR